MVDPTPSRRTKTVAVDSEQLMELVEIGRQTDIYDTQPDARKDNYEAVIATVCRYFRENHLETVDE